MANHSHTRGYLPVNQLLRCTESSDDGLPSNISRNDHGSPDPQGAPAPGTQTPRGPLAYAPKHIREHPLAEALENEHLGAYDPKTGRRIRDGSSNAYFGRTIVDELASCPPDNSDIQAPADPAGDVLAELGALAATSAERERRRAAGDDGWRGFSSNASADVDKLCNAVYPADAIEATVYGAPGDLEAGYDRAAARLHAERATRASKAMAPPNICGAGPAGGDFAAVPRNTAVAKSAMVRIMELTALVEQARALAVQALTDIGSANQSELAAAHDRIATCERTITERDARIAALEAAAQSAIEKLAGGTE